MLERLKNMFVSKKQAADMINLRDELNVTPDPDGEVSIKPSNIKSSVQEISQPESQTLSLENISFSSLSKLNAAGKLVIEKETD